VQPGSDPGCPGCPPGPNTGRFPLFVTLRSITAKLPRLRRAPTAANLNNHHRNTLEEIFTHPTSGNIEWRNVLSLIEAVGTAVEEHNGKLKLTIGSETEVIRPPHGKDIDPQLIADLRKMLRAAGYSPAK
jgi:hypothetical protein